MNEKLFLFLNNFANKSDTADLVFVFFAQYAIYFLIAGTVIFVFKSKENIYKKLIIIFGGAVLAWVISQAINELYPVARPFLALDYINPLFMHGGYDSFPSGHATFAFALAVGLLYYHKPLAWLYLLGAILIGVSRVIAGIHWPIDILGGYMLGSILPLAFYYFYFFFLKKESGPIRR